MEATDKGGTAMAVSTGLPPLPLLSATQNRIVDFAKIYQRSNDEDVYESLLDLSEELAGIAATQVDQREQRARDGTQERLVYAPDQMALLMTTKEGGSGHGETTANKALQAKQQLTQAERARASKGKPMRRFQVSTASPFVNALAISKRSMQQRSHHDEIHDELYVKVQQIAWEDDILWGIDFDAKTKQASGVAESPFIEEKEDDVSNDTRSASTPFARSSSLDPGSRGGVISSRSSQVTTPSSKGYTTLSYKEMYPRRKMPTLETPWVPSKTQEEFDITKPRHYRWEVPDNGVARTRSSQVDKKKTNHDDHSPTRLLQELPCPLNKELDDGSWIDAIGWNSTQEMPESKLILDDNDASLILTVPEMDDIRPTLRIPERKLGAAEIRLEQLDKQRREKKERIDAVMGNLEIGEDTATVGKDPTGKKSKDNRVVKNMGDVHHSMPAIKLTMTKPELPKTKLREFHRPRSKFKINERMVFAQPPVVASIPTEEASVVAQIKKSSDLTPTAGGKLILIEYTEQNPPMLSNPGMAARILHYWRPPEQEEDLAVGKKKIKKTRPKPPDMKMGQMITLGNHDETPFVGDVPAGRVITSLNSKLYKVPIFPHKPVAPFAPSGSARENGQHELFLLCRSVVKGKKSSAIGSDGAKTTLYIYEMPDVFLAGQIEPQIEVPAPNSRSANEFIRPYMSFHILRLFKKASDGERLKIEDIARAFPNQSGTAIRKRMKEVATFERGGNDSGWWKKKPASHLKSEEEVRAGIQPESVCLYESMMAGHRRLLDIGLTKLFAPNGVNGAINLLLKRLELRKQALSVAMIDPLKLERRAKEKAEQDMWKRDPTVRKLETDIQVARYIHEQLQLTPWNLTNNYVECHLQGKGSGMLLLGGIGDPTGRGEGFSFVRVPQSRAKKKEGEEEGATGAGPGGADSTAVQKAVAAVTGTTADLRKLKMKEAGDVLRNLGVAEADIKKLRRWDRIHMVRELSSLATAHGRAGTLSKFARGARKSLSAQQQDYRRKCDVIYERQMNVLSSTSVSFSDDEESGDDSDIIDELEDELLGAGSFGGDDREKIVKLGPKNLFTKGGGGLNRSKEALAEREDAVELERLMKEMKEDSGAKGGSRRPDIDESNLRNQLRASGIKEGSTSASSAAAGGQQAQGGTRPGSSLGMGMSHGGSNAASAMHTPTDHRSRASSPTSASKWSSSGETPSRVPGRKVLKRTTRVVEEDGTETVRIEFIVDDKQVGRFAAKQQRQERQLKAEERIQLRKRKRMLALEDDAPGQSLLDKAKRRKQLQEELKQLQRTEEQNKDYVEMLEKGGDAGLSESGTPQKGAVRCTQCGQVGHMRTNRSCPLYMADGGGGTTNEGAAKFKSRKGGDEVEKITVNLAELREGARKHEAEKKRKRLQEIKEQAELYKRPYTNAAVKQSRSRMPVSHLNGNLGVVIDKLLDMPESELFRAPVDANMVKDYYQIIKQPMDLSSIKKKIQEMQYDSMRDFIKDLEVMVNNSKMYNGDPARSLITANAAKVLKRAQEELTTMNAEGGTTTVGDRS